METVLVAVGLADADAVEVGLAEADTIGVGLAESDVLGVGLIEEPGVGELAMLRSAGVEATGLGPDEGKIGEGDDEGKIDESAVGMPLATATGASDAPTVGVADGSAVGTMAGVALGVTRAFAMILLCGSLVTAPYEVSKDPSELRRARCCAPFPLKSVKLPPTRIFPSARMETTLTWSLNPEPVDWTKSRSMLPSVLIRAMRPTCCPWTRVMVPAIIILLSGWVAKTKMLPSIVLELTKLKVLSTLPSVKLIRANLPVLLKLLSEVNSPVK